MKSLVDLISKIGIFMLAGQAVIHFAPGQKYTKYMKLIVGLMILIQFLSPIYNLMGGMEIDWGEALSDIEMELDGGLINDGNIQANSLDKSIIAGMEKEIKSRLNSEISGEGYSVIKVSVDIDTSQDSYYSNSSNHNSSYEKYKLNKIEVAVRLDDAYEKSKSINENTNANNSSDNNVVKVDKVSIQKITTDEETDEGSEQSDKSGKSWGQNNAYDKQEIRNSLRERFCNVLGIEEEYLEVNIYGAVE